MEKKKRENRYKVLFMIFLVFLAGADSSGFIKYLGSQFPAIFRILVNVAFLATFVDYVSTRKEIKKEKKGEKDGGSINEW